MHPLVIPVVVLKLLLRMVQCVCRARGIERVVTHGWWESFCRRHPDVTLRVTAPLSSSRAKSTDVNVINKYFDMFQAMYNGGV